MANHINDLFEACTPKEEQKAKMFSEVLKESAKISCKKTSSFNVHHWIRWSRPIVACMLCLLLGVSAFSFIVDRTTFNVYAYGSNTEITNTGVELTTGIIRDDGEMHGQLMQLYVKGENIDTIRFSCKNQYIDFTDWTENRPYYSMEKQFTVSYGKETSDYYYLVVNWNPENTIRKLTDNTDINITNLSEELRNDIIVMEVTFMDGSTATKAIKIMLQDSGKILAKLQDYVVTKNDDFVLNPQKSLSSQTKISKDDELQTNSTNFSEIDIEAARAIAKKYYSSFSGDHEIVAIEYTENSNMLSGGVANEYKDWQIIAFKAYEKSMYPNIARTILLARENSKKEWIIINEGY